MTDETQHDGMYECWIADRQSAEPPRELTDQVMASIETQNVQRTHQVRLIDRMNESQPAQLAACLASCFVGSLPIFYAAYVAKLLVF